jgi:hypothetical protein
MEKDEYAAGSGGSDTSVDSTYSTVRLSMDLSIYLYLTSIILWQFVFRPLAEAAGARLLWAASLGSWVGPKKGPNNRSARSKSNGQSSDTFKHFMVRCSFVL